MQNSNSSKTQIAAFVAAAAVFTLASSVHGEEPLVFSEINPESSSETTDPTPNETSIEGSDNDSIEIAPTEILELIESFNSERLDVLNDASLREERINAHRPPPIATSHDSLLPPIVRVQTQRLRGIILEAIEDYEGTHRALEVCIGLGDETIDNWQRLARARLHTGDFSQSEAAFLAAYQLNLAHEPERADQRAIILQELGELYLFTRQFDNAHLVLNAAADLDPGRARIKQLLERVDLEMAGEFGNALRTEQPLWPETRAQQIRAQIELQLNRGFRNLPEALSQPLRRAGGFALTQRGRQIGLASVAGLALLMMIVRRLRGHGDLVIAIDFPHELRGSFTVRISDQPGQHKRSKTGEDRSSGGREVGSSRTLHQKVGRETQFQRLIPKIYYVVVDGMLMDPDSGETLSKPFDEHAVEILKGQTVRLEFDLHPRECPVDVHVFWDKHPTEEAGVAARGLPNSLRHTRAGVTRLRLRKGKHMIVVGSGDRVAEREVDVQSYSPTTVSFDLAGSEGVVFKGCPPAVTPYLHGDHNSAARALSRDGHNRIANILLARLHRDLGQSGRAAEYFEAAGQHLEAAELRATLQDYSAAALLFEEAGDSRRCAEMFREACEWLRAGEAFESIEDFQEAAACFREANEVGRWLGALERDGAYFTAAQIALERSDRARAIRLLQLVPLDSPDYANACELLADAFEHEGHADLAAQKIEQRISSGDRTPDLQSRLGTLLESSGELQRALDTLESLRDDEPTYPNIATRIEGLRKKITAQSLSQASEGRTSSNTTAPTAFLAEKRYEILGELGRGGMGIVYKATDLRLNREVALKRLPENLREHPKAIQLFLREAQACARLNHRNIVTIFDTDQDDNNFFITMELLQGYPVNVIRRKRGRIAVRDAARLGMQVADGLHYAHSQGIVHRDIKTANLFFTTDKVVKIMDFGLAKMMEEVRRGTTVMGGTPYYMAPEQAQGGAVDQRADIYALGVTLYELVTGGVPFTDGDVAYHHSHTPVTDPRERATGIGDEMAELILHMMEKDPEQRCASAEEVGRRLTEIANQPD